MLAQPKQPKPAPAVPKSAPTAQVAPEPEQAPTGEPSAAWDSGDQDGTPQFQPVDPITTDGIVTGDESPADTFNEEPIGTNRVPSDINVEITPTKAPLTEDNVENLPDASTRAPTETVASTRDASSVVGSVTPSYSASQQLPISRPPAGGYATSAWRATGVPGRSASFQRKMMEQREAVVMPGNHAVDRAAVQFGSMGLSGDENGKPLDVDDEREDAETRTQPPQQSPSQPRASLPTVNLQHSIGADPPTQENFPTPKQASGFPAAIQPPVPSAAISQNPPTAPASQSFGAPGQSGTGPAYNQYGRFGTGSMGQDHTAPTQKPHDAFGQEITLDQQSILPVLSQPSRQSSQTAQSLPGGLSQAPTEPTVSHTSENPRSAYQSYYAGGAFGPQTSSNLSENAPPERSTSGIGANDSGLSSTNINQNQSRFNDNHASGHNTPNPSIGSQGHQPQQMHQQPPGQTAHGGGFPYSNPYYGGYNYGAYMNQVSGKNLPKISHLQ